MSIALWIAAAVLGLVFLASGAVKILRTKDQVVQGGYGWAAAYPPSVIKLIGAAEVAGAIGMNLPPAMDILPVLSPVAATGLTVLMAGAVVVHLQRREAAKLGVPVVLLTLTALFAISRFIWCPF